MRWAFAFLLLGTATLTAQDPLPVPPPPTGLPGKPFFIKKTWIIGGHGNWDYLTMDAPADRLYITHGPTVQVVDVSTGNLAGEVKGLREAHAVALDPAGQFGYISDGGADQVKIFDRQTFEVVASIPTGPSPRALALDPESNLLIAVCAGPHPPPEQPPANRPGRPPQRNPRPPANEEAKSILTIIDVQTRAELAEIVVDGRFGFAAGDGKGAAFIAVEDRNRIARLDLDPLSALLRQPPVRRASAQSTSAASPPEYPLHLDWSSTSHAPSGNRPLRFFSTGTDCREPRALSVDSTHLRLFAACSNMKMAVLDATTGDAVTTLPIGPGVDAVGYDVDRGLIYSANGGAQGSLTIIRQDVTDTYSVVQTLATRQRARTLAVNSSTGEVYLVTILEVAKTGPPPMNGIGTLKTVPEDSSFQVLVVGN
jgi:DNA-binding beta-propeller fold protein YncE